MAEELDDGEFWLPSEFLTDDDIIMEKNKIVINNNSKGENNNKTQTNNETGAGGFCFPSEFPYGFGKYDSSSALSSPVESVVSSTETESDEEDYVAGLTQQMVHSTLQEVKKNPGSAFCSSEKPKAYVLSGSPQSTLCTVGSWSGCSGGSSRGSPNGPSQVSSPPTTPMNEKDDAWELLYAAAGQVVRMKMNEEAASYHHGRGLLGPPRKPTPVTAPLKNPNVGIYSNQAVTQQQLKTAQFHQLKQQHCSDVWGRNGRHAAPNPQQNPHHQQLHNGGKCSSGVVNGRCGRPLGLSSSAWPPLQQHHQAGSGMRAVFLGGSGTRRESSGTGVFLPRRIGNPADSRKKPACSTVLLPARVVQALNLSFDDVGVAQQRFNGGFTLDHEAMMSRSNALFQQQKRNNIRPQAAAAAAIMNHEIRLPQEWTY